MSCPSCPRTGMCSVCGEETKVDALLGRVIAGYELRRCIGRGGFGAIYEAFSSEQNQRVALKILRQELAESREVVLRFRREAEATRRLEHPNIVKILGSGEEDGLLWIAMELLDGVSLDAYLARVGTLSEGQFLSLFAPICEALQEAHSKGVIHRDLKPPNIMLLSKDDPAELSPILLDFGIASLVGADTLTTKSAISGTPRYMAPEQWEGLHNAESRSDVYALGVIAYQCLSGRLPFEADTPLAWMKKHHFEEPRALSVALGEKRVSAHICSAVMMALQKSPADRPESPLAFWRSLSVSGAPTPKRAPLSPRASSASSLAATEQMEKPLAGAALVPAPLSTPARSRRGLIGVVFGSSLMLVLGYWFYSAEAGVPVVEPVKSLPAASPVMAPQSSSPSPLSPREPEAQSLLSQCRVLSEEERLDEAARVCSKLNQDTQVYQSAAAEVRAILREFRRLHRDAIRAALSKNNREGIAEAGPHLDILQEIFGDNDEDALALQREIKALESSLGPSPEVLYAEIESQRRRGDVSAICKAIKSYLKQAPKGKNSEALRQELKGYDPAGYPECDLK